MSKLELVQPVENSTDNLLTPKEVAAILKVNASWIHNHCTRTEPLLPFVNLGGSRRFRPQDVNQFIEDNLCAPRKRA